VCDLETSRMGAPYIYDISHLRVKFSHSDSHKKQQCKCNHLLCEKLAT